MVWLSGRKESERDGEAKEEKDRWAGGEALETRGDRGGQERRNTAAAWPPHGSKMCQSESKREKRPILIL